MPMRPVPDQNRAIPPLGGTETRIILLISVRPMGLRAFGVTPWLIHAVEGVFVLAVVTWMALGMPGVWLVQTRGRAGFPV